MLDLYLLLRRNYCILMGLAMVSGVSNIWWKEKLDTRQTQHVVEIDPRCRVITNATVEARATFMFYYIRLL